MNSTALINLLSYRLLLHDLDNNRAFRDIGEQQRNEYFAKGDMGLSTTLGELEEKSKEMEMLNLLENSDKKLLQLMKLYGYDSRSLKRNIYTSRIQGTDYVQVSAFSEHPELSAFIVNTLCKEFIRYFNYLNNQQMIAKVNTYEELVKQKKKRLEEANMELTSFKSSYQVIDVGMESSRQLERIQDLEVALEKEIRKLESSRYELQLINKQIISENANPSSSTVHKSNVKIVTLRQKINDLTKEYSVQDMEKEIADSLIYLRTLLQKELLRGADIPDEKKSNIPDLRKARKKLELEIAVSEQNVNQYMENLRAQRATFQGFNHKELQILKFEREIQLAQNAYAKAQNRYNEALDDLIKKNNGIEQIIFGQPAYKPEPSKATSSVILSVLSSFIFCILSILLLNFINVSIRKPSEFVKSVPLTPLAMFNRIGTKDLKHIDEIFKGSESRKSWRGDISLYRESFRNLRYQIDISARKVIMFVSNKRQEGKSTLIQGLAHTLSMRSKKLLLIDANLSENTITKKMVGVPPLSYELTENNILKNRTRSTIKGVDILVNPRREDLINGTFPTNYYKKCINLLREEYDFVLIEVAAMGEFADAHELVDISDGVIAVFSARSIIGQSEKDFIKFLSDKGNKVIGTILNKIEQEDYNY